MFFKKATPCRVAFLFSFTQLFDALYEKTIDRRFTAAVCY